VWVATDEWTSDQGIAIVNILIGCEGKIYVTGCLHIACKGDKLGVEHSAVGHGILENLRVMDVSLTNILAVATDSAAVLKKAFDEIVQPASPEARWAPCASHILNNCAKVFHAYRYKCHQFPNFRAS
jgi:hypothetical protein